MKIKWGNILIFIFIILLGLAAGLAAIILNNNSLSVKKPVQPTQNIIEDKSKDIKFTRSSPNSVLMGLDSWIGGTPALIAISRQYDKNYEISLEVKSIPNRMNALKTGEIDVTEITLASFLKYRENIGDIATIIGITDFSMGADGIIAKSDVKDLNDMKDRTVSYVGDGTGKFILNKFLRLTGLMYEDIKPVERSNMKEAIDDLENGSSDLAVSWSPDMNVALKEINKVRPDSLRMMISTREAPNLVPTLLVVRNDYLKNNEKKVESFLKAWYASVKYINENPENAHQKLTELMNSNPDIYDKVEMADVRDSFTNIKLMALDDIFEIFGQNGKTEKISAMIIDTNKTWKLYGDMKSDITNPLSFVNTNLIAKLKSLNDPEILVGRLDSGLYGANIKPEQSAGFKKLDEKTVETKTEKVAKVDIAPVYYDSGKATVKQASLPVLDEVASILDQFPQYYLIIDAHTDSVGSNDSNLSLSKSRADTIKAYLIKKGFDPNRVISRGWGKFKPIVPNEQTEQDRAKNRRTEFTLKRELNKVN